ncbi:aminopeptidase [archaeon]
MKPDWLAKKIVNYTLGIGQKENTDGIKKAERKYGKRVLPLLKKKKVAATKKNTKMLDDLCGVDYGPLFVKKGKGYVPKTKVGHSVIITFNAANKKVAEGIRRECILKGAHTLMLERSTKAIREAYALSPTDTVRELSPISTALHSTADYYINLEAIENEFWKKGISPNKFKASAPSNMKLHEIRDKRLQRWCYVGWPHPKIAKELKLPPRKVQAHCQRLARRVVQPPHEAPSRRLLPRAQGHGQNPYRARRRHRPIVFGQGPPLHARRRNP